MQVKTHGISVSNSNDFNRCNNSNNNNSYNSQLVNSFLNKSSPTRSNPPSLDIVGKVSFCKPILLLDELLMSARHQYAVVSPEHFLNFDQSIPLFHIQSIDQIRCLKSTVLKAPFLELSPLHNLHTQKGGNLNYNSGSKSRLSQSS